MYRFIDLTLYLHFQHIVSVPIGCIDSIEWSEVREGQFLLVSGIASIFVDDYSSVFPTDDRPIIDFFTPL